MGVKKVMHFGVGSDPVFLKLLLFVSMMQSNTQNFIHILHKCYNLSTVRQTFLQFLYKSSLTLTYAEFFDKDGTC